MHYRQSRSGLHMLADSTGIKFLDELVEKASERPRSKEHSAAASGARCIWVLMQRLCRYERLW